MANDIKRLNYFTGQFLDAQDFRDEQTYHNEMRWRGNRALFGPGVSMGMEVVATTNKRAIIVAPGVAFDDKGHELVILPPTSEVPATEWPVPSDLTGQVNVVISYSEALTDSHSVGGYTGATRVSETTKVEIQTAAATASQSVLATLQLDADGVIQSVNSAPRQASPIWLDAGHTILGKGRLHIHGEELLFLLNKDGVRVGKEWGGTGALSVEGKLTAEGSADVQGNLNVTSDGGVLNLEGSSHAYMQWFPKGVAAGRKAWIGFGEVNTDALTIRNDAGRMHIYGEEILFLLNKAGVRVGKAWGGTGALNVEGKLTAEASADVRGNLNVTSDGGVLNLEGSSHAYMQWFPKGVAAGRKAWIGFGEVNTDALTIRNDAGRMHIYGEEILFLLNKAGVRVGKEWGGSGALSVAGGLVAEADALVRGTLSVEGELLAQRGITVTNAISVGGGGSFDTISYSGTQNKLDVAEGDVYATIRAHDLWLGHSLRRGTPGRALVDNSSTLVVNFGADWANVRIEGTVRTPSSRKLKDNICLLSGDVARRIVSTLEPVSFSYKRDKSNSQCLGFVAEDTPPEIAAGDGETIVVNHIVAALTKVVKDQQRLIETLEARLGRLESRHQPGLKLRAGSTSDDQRLRPRRYSARTPVAAWRRRPDA